MEKGKNSACRSGGSAERVALGTVWECASFCRIGKVFRAYVRFWRVPCPLCGSQNGLCGVFTLGQGKYLQKWLLGNAGVLCGPCGRSLRVPGGRQAVFGGTAGAVLVCSIAKRRFCDAGQVLILGICNFVM